MAGGKWCGDRPTPRRLGIHDHDDQEDAEGEYQELGAEARCDGCFQRTCTGMDKVSFAASDFIVPYNH